jgi:PAS domain S-box-containing protein
MESNTQLNQHRVLPVAQKSTGQILSAIFFPFTRITENLKKTRERELRIAELEANEERYRAVVEQTTEGIVLLDSESLRVIECNNAFSRLIGCSDVEEAKRLNARDFSTASEEKLAEIVQHFRQGNGVISGERLYLKRDGSHILVDATGSLITYGGRAVICTSVRDLSDRKNAENELQRLALVAQKTQNTVIVSDIRGKIEWVNEGFMRTTGYDMSEVEGKSSIDFLTGAETDGEILSQLFASIQALKPFNGELFKYKKNGEGYWSSISLTPIKKSDGTLQGFISIEMDVTERKKMEAQLRRAYEDLEQRVFERTADLLRANEDMQLEVREREKAELEVRDAREFLNKIIDNVPTLIAVRNSKDRFTMANSAFAKMYGTTIENMIGKTPVHFYNDPDELRKVVEEDKFVITQGQEKPVFEDKYTGPSGKIHYLETIKRPLVSDSGEKNILIIANDLTERKALESQLRNAQKLESIGQLAAGIAHEINTPTQYVSDNTRFLSDAFDDIKLALDEYHEAIKAAEQGKLDPSLIEKVQKKIAGSDLDYLLTEVPAAISQSLEGVSRIAKIVQSMKDFAHPGSTEKTAVDLNKAIESTITVARNEWKYVAELETHFDETLPAVPCFIGEFNQVVLNIIINASHAIADVVGDGAGGKGKITISTSLADDEWVEIRIQDTGAGIPSRIQNRIFDPFFTTKEIGKGSGQGLAISHTVIVDKHGGKLTFDTGSSGTTFIIGLPIPPNEKLFSSNM